MVIRDTGNVSPPQTHTHAQTHTHTQRHSKCKQRRTSEYLLERIDDGTCVGPHVSKCQHVYLFTPMVMFVCILYVFIYMCVFEHVNVTQSKTHVVFGIINHLQLRAQSYFLCTYYISTPVCTGT